MVSPTGLEGEGHSVEGRLQDLLFRTLVEPNRHRGCDRVGFDVLFLMQSGKWEKVHVVAAIRPGDQGEPVMTLMLLEDD